nr:LysM peptidoglycan-binding domain-containing protein [Candidatus Njordarchaeota archaeon]
MIPLRKVWKKLEHGETLATIAGKYGISSKTLSKALRRIDGDKYEETKNKKRREQLILPMTNEVWKRLEHGETLDAVAREYKVSYTVISSVLKRNDTERYESIMRNRRRKELNLPVAKLWKKLKRGNTVTAIAKEHDIKGNTLAHILQRIYGNEYDRIMGNRRRRQAILSVISKVWNKLEHGETLTTVAERYAVGRTTLARMLRTMNGKKYRKLVTSRSRRELSLIMSGLPITKVWRKLDHGNTLVALAKQYNVCPSTLAKILRIDDEKRYEEITRRRRNTGQYGSLEARKHGADSAIELRVRELLEKHGVHFEYHCDLRLKGHRYQPDFVFGDNMILEVTGLTTEGYWSHCRKKINDYVEAGYRVFIVLPNYMYDIVRRYLPHNSETKVMEYKDFERQIAGFLTQVNIITKRLNEHLQ